MNKSSYMSVKGQGHSLTLAKGHLVSKLNLVFFLLFFFVCFLKKTVGLFETKYYVKGKRAQE